MEDNATYGGTKNMRKLILLVMFGLLTATTVHAQPAVQTAPATPLAVLYSYYTEINLGDYLTAYNHWVNPPMTYARFSSGFNATTHIVPYFAPFTGTAGAGSVRSVLLGYRADGLVESYAGCFNLSYVGAGWYITGANLTLLANGSPPTNAAISTELAQSCTSNPAPALGTYDAADQLVVNYFDLINRRSYASAYSLWLSPQPGPQPNGSPATDYRRPFDRFVSGYADTRYGYVYFGDYQFMGAAAGKPYLQGMLPMVLVGDRWDGGFRAFYGCWVIGTFTNGALGIVNGRFYQFMSDTPSGTDILSRVNIDCTTLNIPN